MHLFSSSVKKSFRTYPYFVTRTSKRIPKHFLQELNEETRNYHIPYRPELSMMTTTIYHHRNITINMWEAQARKIGRLNNLLRHALPLSLSPEARWKKNARDRKKRIKANTAHVDFSRALSTSSTYLYLRLPLLRLRRLLHFTS